MKRIARLLLLAALAAAVPVYAATFVKDVMLIGGNESETTALKTSYADRNLHGLPAGFLAFDPLLPYFGETGVTMRNAEKDAAEKAERRARLLEAAFRLMSARSIEAVKLTEIAEAAGLGIVTLYRYFKTKPDLVIELGVVLWKKYYVEVEKAYAARGGAAMNAAEEMEFFIDSIIELYRSHKDVLRFNRNFDTYVKHQECTAEQMRPYNEAVNVFATKFHTVYLKAKKDGTLDIHVSEKRLFVGTLYAVLSVAGKFAEGLVYPSEDHHNMLDELLMIKQMILGALKKGRMGTVGTMGTLATATPQGPQSLQGPQSPQKGVAC